MFRNRLIVSASEIRCVFAVAVNEDRVCFLKVGPNNADSGTRGKQTSLGSYEERDHQNQPNRMLTSLQPDNDQDLATKLLGR